MNKDLYKILEIEKTATKEDIKKAYRKLAMQYHPDRNPGDKKAEEKFKAIVEAYEILYDEEKRSNYDQFGDPNGRPQFRQHKYRSDDFDIHTFHTEFEHIFRHMHGMGSPFNDIFSQKLDVRVDYTITLEEAFTGKKINATINIPNRGKKQLNVTIPAGIEHGSKIRFVGEGMLPPARNSRPGDLYINILISPHQKFKRLGQNLFTTIMIDAIDAMLGTTTEIIGIDGSVLNIIIPPGTQYGEQLRCRGQGFSIQGMQNRGDLILEIGVTIPKNLTSEDKIILQKIKDNKANIQ